MYQSVKGIENTGLLLEKFVLGHASVMSNQTALAFTVKKSTIYNGITHQSLISAVFLDS